MCGIAGIVYGEGWGEKAQLDVERMIHLQRHRGPDGQGIHHSPGVVLGHCRLAIIDTSESGRQPMCDSSGRYWITFNGEIYNYLELRKQLAGLGRCFAGGSDTEVLLASYVEWGDSVLPKLRGMFAFAIWDTLSGTLFAARDPFGIKPFHYAVDEQGRFIFASEIKAILP